MDITTVSTFNAIFILLRFTCLRLQNLLTLLILSLIITYFKPSLFLSTAHAFFTIQLSSETNKYVLKRLSNEFIFMAPSSDDEQTGDVIQFASGLDLIGSDIDGKLLVSYGINDCEAATFFLGMEMVQDLLIDVEEGVEVVNLMRKLGT